MDHVRTNLSHANNFDVSADVDTQGVVWVADNAGGISTQEIPDVGWSRVWKLPAGTSIPSELTVWNDVPGHWTWDPARRMPLGEYAAALATVNGLFTRIK
jgi:hypothetical protein